MGKNTLKPNCVLQQVVNRLIMPQIIESISKQFAQINLFQPADYCTLCVTLAEVPSFRLIPTITAKQGYKPVKDLFTQGDLSLYQDLLKTTIPLILVDKMQTVGPNEQLRIPLTTVQGN